MEKTYFIVDDHYFMRVGVTTWIKEHSSWECIGSSNSIKSTIDTLNALAALGTFPTILITDINLENNNTDSSGLELISQVHALFPELKIICYTMYKSVGFINDALRRGAMGYICKNSAEKDLLNCMEKVAAGEKNIEEELQSSVKTCNNALSALTKREQEVFYLILQYKSNDEIASELNVQKRAVESYTSRIYDKLYCENREKLLETYS